jgi:hypothetical protein
VSELARLARTLNIKGFALMSIDPTGYFDESAVPNEVFVIAGYMSNLAQWKQLEGAWNYAFTIPTQESKGNGILR